MAIIAKCDGCGSGYSFRDDQAGRVLPCKKCGNVIEVRGVHLRDDEDSEPIFLDDADGPPQLPRREIGPTNRFLQTVNVPNERIDAVVLKLATEEVAFVNLGAASYSGEDF